MPFRKELKNQTRIGRCPSENYWVSKPYLKINIKDLKEIKILEREMQITLKIEVSGKTNEYILAILHDKNDDFNWTKINQILILILIV